MTYIEGSSAVFCCCSVELWRCHICFCFCFCFVFGDDLDSRQLRSFLLAAVLNYGDAIFVFVFLFLFLVMIYIDGSSAVFCLLLNYGDAIFVRACEIQRLFIRVFVTEQEIARLWKCVLLLLKTALLKSHPFVIINSESLFFIEESTQHVFFASNQFLVILVTHLGKSDFSNLNWRQNSFFILLDWEKAFDKINTTNYGKACTD